MSVYHFTAITSSGSEQKGVIEADSEKHARQLLREKSLLPIQLKPANEKKQWATFQQWHSYLKRRRLSSKDLALITRQFATLLAAGLPIEEALLAVAEQTERSQTKTVLLSVRGTVLEGHALAAALGEHPDVFSSLFCATIAAGEKSGHLDKVLLRLADYTEKQANLRQKLSTALIYPVMIVLVAFGIVGFLLEYVVPKMVAVYGHLNQALPLLTSVLIDISEGVQRVGIYFLIGFIFLLYLFFRAMKKNMVFRKKTHQFFLRLPLVGYAIKTADTARFARTLSILAGAGVPVLEAMTISSELIGNIPIRESVKEAVLRVREGGAIYLALKQTGYFSPMSVHMTASGEASGQLENMLERVAIMQEDDLTRLLEVSLALFEPAIILIMGAIVLFIVLAVLLPIFQLNQFTG